MPDRASLRIVRGTATASGRQSGRRIEVVGEAQYQDTLVELAGGKEHESKYIATNAELWREPDNPHDASAVQVRIGGRVVGYLPRLEARRVAERMDSAGQHALACPAEIRGGWSDGDDEGSFGVVIWLPRSRMG